jgi:hypothetical protein
MEFCIQVRTMDAGKITFNNFIAPLKGPGALPEKIPALESLTAPAGDNVAITFPQEKPASSPSKKATTPYGDNKKRSESQQSKSNVTAEQQLNGDTITPGSAMGSVPVVLFQEESLPAMMDDKVESQKPAESHQHHRHASVRKDRTDGLLKRIAREKEQYGLKLQPPCDQSSRMSLRDQVSAELSKHLPDDYVSFLEKTDGLDHDGLVFYGSHPAPIEGYRDRRIDGLIEANHSLGDVKGLQNYLVIGESEDLLFAYRHDASCYVALDSTSTKECRSYSSFREMLDGALRDMA